MTQFVKSCPYTTQLGALIGKAPSMISKLKNSSRYGDLQSTAQALWKWLQSNGIQKLQEKLGLTDEDIKKTMTEVGDMARENTLDLIKQRIQVKRAINDRFLQHHMIKDIVNALASIADKNQEENIDLVFPTKGIQNLDDGCLTVTRERFNLLLGVALSFLSLQDADEIQKYVKELEIAFQNSQEVALGFSIHVKLVPTAIKDQNLLNDSLFNITGGLSAILSTTPDKAFVLHLREYITEDFRTVVTFIKVMELIALKDQVSRLNSAKEQLLAFSVKWSEANVTAYLQNVDEKSLESAQEFMRKIRSLINDIKA